MKHVLLIFTNDLRLSSQSIVDHLEAARLSYVPVYLDFLQLIPSHEFYPINVAKQKFSVEAVDALKKSLYVRDKELLVIKNDFKEALLDIINKNGCTQVFLSRHTISPLTTLLESMELMLMKNNVFIKYFDTNYLIDLDDLPFPLRKMPDDFKVFVSKIKGVKLHSAEQPVVVPEGVLEILDEIQEEEVPVLLPYKTRLNNHFSKFLPYLTSGRLSPSELLAVVADRANVSPYFDKKALKVLTNQLVKLDFIRAKMRNRQRDAFFEIDLINAQVYLVERWIEGQTDNELINAIMHKLKNKSMISLTSKKLAILYYLKVLKLPAYFGFHYFENQLLEFDSSLNQYLWMEYEAMDFNEETFDQLLIEDQRLLDPKDSFIEFWN